MVQSPKPPESWNTKKLLPPKKEQNPPSGCPRKYKKYRQNTNMAQKIVILVLLGYLFRIFGGQSGVGDLFFGTFSYFRDSGFFWALYHPRSVATVGIKTWTWVRVSSIIVVWCCTCLWRRPPGKCYIREVARLPRSTEVTAYISRLLNSHGSCKIRVDHAAPWP